MKEEYQSFRDKVSDTLRTLAKEEAIYKDAQMVVGASEAKASLKRSDVFKSIDAVWVEEIEKTLPALDTIIRNPSIAIEDVDEILPVELSKHISDKSVKHLAQHTNLILNMTEDEVIPQKILNVYHDETYLTYENKFINTLLMRLSTFIEKRYKVLAFGSGTERNYKFNYSTKFEHHNQDDGGRNTAQINLSIELTSPFNAKKSESNKKIYQNYKDLMERVSRIYATIESYQTSTFVQKLGRNFIHPPVIRTNAILKNKNMRECLNLWEFIESFDKVGYTVTQTDSMEMPSDEYISDLYSTVALQYVNFFEGVTDGNENRMLAKKRLYELDPEFKRDFKEEEQDDFNVYDSEYKKLVPFSRLMEKRKKQSADEKKIADVIAVTLKADDLYPQYQKEIEKIRLAKEQERLRLEEENRKLEEAKRLEEERRLAEIRRLEQEKIDLAKAQDIFAPEDGDFTGRYPICPYTRREFNALGPKTKKQVKHKMEKASRYRELKLQIARIKRTTNDLAKIEHLEEKCVKLSKRLPEEEGWKIVLECHNHY